MDAAYVDAELLVRGREDTGHRSGRSAAAEPVLAGQGRGRLHDRPLRGRLGRAAGALPAGEAVLGLEPAGRPRRHALRLGLVPQGGLRRLPGSAPVHPGRAPGPAPEAAAAGRARGAQGERASGSAPRRGGAATPGGPGSRAPSRKGCAPSGCAAAATAGWPRRTCSTWRPRPRSISTASPPGSGRCRAPPPAPRASPRSPLEPTSPTVSGGYSLWNPTGGPHGKIHQRILATAPAAMPRKPALSICPRRDMGRGGGLADRRHSANGWPAASAVTRAPTKASPAPWVLQV